MVRELHSLAEQLGISEGGLLKLAREIAHDGALVSVAHMRHKDQVELRVFLLRALAHQPVDALVTYLAKRELVA